MAALFYLWCNFCDFLWFSPINDVSCSPPLYIPCSLNPYPYCRPIRIRRRRGLSSGHKKRRVLRHIPVQTTGHRLPSTHVCSTSCQHVHYRKKEKSNPYKCLLDSIKTDYYREKFGNCDDRKLFHLVQVLSVPSKKTVLPDSSSHYSLASKFSRYFRDKIDKLQELCNYSNSSYSLSLLSLVPHTFAILLT